MDRYRVQHLSNTDVRSSILSSCSFKLAAVSRLLFSVAPLCEDWTRRARWEQAEPEAEDGLFCRQARTRSDSTSQNEK